jgi:hypothetical protein
MKNKNKLYTTVSVLLIILIALGGFFGISKFASGSLAQASDTATSVYTNPDFPELKIPLLESWQVTASNVSASSMATSLQAGNTAQGLVLSNGKSTFNLNFLSGSPRGLDVPLCWDSKTISYINDDKFTLIKENSGGISGQPNFYFFPTNSITFSTDKNFTQTVSQFMEFEGEIGQMGKTKDIIACQSSSNLFSTKSTSATKKLYLNVSVPANSSPSAKDLEDFSKIINSIEGINWEETHIEPI